MARGVLRLRPGPGCPARGSGPFAPFDLTATGYHPRYQTVQAHGPDDIELFGNLPAELHAELARAG
jgi:hypothetical protein